MRLVGLISGGKDSLYNMLQCIAAGHEIVAVANIEPDKKEELDSFMYQSVGHQVVSLIAGALGLPIYRQKTKGKAVCKNKAYKETVHDEVEDLTELLNKVKKDMIIEGVSVGAIASDYQRTRVENVCGRMGLRCFAYLWRRDQTELLQEMIEAGIDAIIIKVASIGLNPEVHLGMHIRDMFQYLVDLNRKFGVHICGEGGEYETLTLDCPLFHRMITITESENVVLSNDAFAPVAFLNVKNATLKTKLWGNDDPVLSLQTRLNHIRTTVKDPYSYVQDCVDEIFPQHHRKTSSMDLPFPFEKTREEESTGLQEYWKKRPLSKPPSTQTVSFSVSAISNLDTTNCNLNFTSGWCCIGNISGPNLSDVLVCLQMHLERIKYEFCDIVLVNLYVRNMAEFASVNKVYSQFFPDFLPPARVCVATTLPPEIGVILTVVAHKVVSKSQKVFYTTTSVDRDAMHVQSISHWAPANIGPYSQCVKVGGLYYLAGQIPLIPGTMEILNKPIFHQCRLTLRHVLRVIEAMNESLGFAHILQAICYVTSEEIASDIYSLWSYITLNETATVTAVAVEELPKNAQLEWEILACSYEHPKVAVERLTTDEYVLEMKRCLHKEPFASSAVAKVKLAKKQTNMRVMTQTEYQSILRHFLEFLRTNDKNIVTPLCMLKLFYRSNETTIASMISEISKCSPEYKVVATGIPVVACEKPEVFLTITGVCH